MLRSALTPSLKFACIDTPHSCGNGTLSLLTAGRIAFTSSLCYTHGDIATCLDTISIVSVSKGGSEGRAKRCSALDRQKWAFSQFAGSLVQGQTFKLVSSACLCESAACCLQLSCPLGGIEHSQALANSAFTKPHGPEIRIILFDGFVDEQESAPSRMEQVVRLQRCPVAHLPRWQR